MAAPRFGLIAAMRKLDRVIGINGKLPFTIPEDRRYFKNVTANSILIMGRYTFEEDGVHLPHASKTIVLTTTGALKVRPGSSLDHVSTSPSLSAALDAAAAISASAPVWVVGGEKVYEEALQHPGAEELHLTVVDCQDASLPPAASVAKFPGFQLRDWRKTKEWQGGNLTNCSPGVSGLTFSVYARVREQDSNVSLLSNGAVDPFGHTGQAVNYLSFRPQYPTSFIDDLKNSRSLDLAVDVCCGPGTLTRHLSPFYRRVIGLDRSVSQLLAAAPPDSSVSYVAGDAYELPVASSSVDLICIGQGLHWLACDRFAAEARRALKDGGRVVVLGYAFPRFRAGSDSRLQSLLDNFYIGALGSDKEPGSEGCYWEISRPAVDGGLPDAVFDGFANVTRDWAVERWDMTCNNYLAYLSTLSGYRAYVSATRSDPLEILRQELLHIVNGEDTLRLEIPYFRIAAVKK